MVGQQAGRLLPGHPARHVHVDKFVFRHRIYCAGRARLRIASAPCLMLRSPPLPRYAPPPKRSKPRSTITSRRSNAGRGTTIPPSMKRSTHWPPLLSSTTNCSTTATTRSPLRDPGCGGLPPPYAGPEEPNALSVLIRRDYAVVEPPRLLAQAQRIADLDPDDRGGGSAAVVGSSVHAALGVLFGEYEPDEIASRHMEFGLEEGDSTLWVTAAEEPPRPGSGSAHRSTTRIRNWWSAASTSARSSTRTKRTSCRPAWWRTAPDPSVGRAPFRARPTGRPGHRADASSRGRSRVVRSCAGDWATARWSA